MTNDLKAAAKRRFTYQTFNEGSDAEWHKLEDSMNIMHSLEITGPEEVASLCDFLNTYVVVDADREKIERYKKALKAAHVGFCHVHERIITMPREGTAKREQALIDIDKVAVVHRRETFAALGEGKKSQEKVSPFGKCAVCLKPFNEHGDCGCKKR